MSEPTWKLNNREFTERVARRFMTDARISGVAIGGSMARGEDWEHSDLEIAVVSKEALGLPYFNIIEGRGVELFQFTEAELREKIDAARSEAEKLAALPIQLYQCAVRRDDAGLFAEFKELLDRRLFENDIVAIKKAGRLRAFDDQFAPARDLLAAGKPRSAIAKARGAFNDLILAFHWDARLLPRSQNRTETLLREHCAARGRMDFHAAFIELYGLEIEIDEARRRMAACRADIDRVFAAWGATLPDFFRYAVDGELSWGNERSTLTVYRLYLAKTLERNWGVVDAYDDPEWRKDNAALVAFMGLSDEPDAEGIFARVGRQRELLG